MKNALDSTNLAVRSAEMDSTPKKEFVKLMILTALNIQDHLIHKFAKLAEKAMYLVLMANIVSDNNLAASMKKEYAKLADNHSLLIQKKINVWYLDA